MPERELEDRGALRHELRRLRERVTQLEDRLKREPTVEFLRRLVEETMRARRYKHPFSLLVARAPEISPRELYQSVRPQLRSTDIVAVIPRPRDKHGRPVDASNEPREVAAILPETDRDGAQTAVNRLRGNLRYVKEGHFYLAAFPDDADDPYELLRKADHAA